MAANLPLNTPTHMTPPTSTTGATPGQQEIGAYFGLELPSYGNIPQNHPGRSVMLNSGRNALEYILRHLPGITRLHLPAYACPALLQPLARLGIPHTAYAITPRLELEQLPRLQPNEHILYINYYALKEHYIDTLAAHYGSSLIIDNSQSLYSPPRPGIPSFYSPRKNSGLPDGGIAVLDRPALPLEERDTSYPAAGYLLQRLEQTAETAALACEQSERRLDNLPMRRISLLTERLMHGIDYETARRIRWENFTNLHNALRRGNKLAIDPASIAVPYCYPLWTGLPGLRDHLIDHGILIPRYWPETLGDTLPGSTERQLADNLLPLPVDQRYTAGHMKRIIRTIADYYAD